jgi:hypothetical protein
MQYIGFALAVLGLTFLMVGAMVGLLAEGSEKPFSHGLVVAGIFMLGLSSVCELLHLVPFL